MAQTEQALLYALRSPTTPLAEKVQRATAALDAAVDSQTLPPLVRDWAFDILLKATRIQSLAEVLLDANLWALTARTTLATPSLNMATPALPIFVAFVSQYTTSALAGVAILHSAAQIWARIAPVAMRKATVDAGLDSYEKLLVASLEVYRTRGTEEQVCWAELAVPWLAALRNVVLDAGKGGKKVPSHTLSLMPTLLPLLATLPPSSPLRNSLLQTVQLALFNLDNLRRGLARESYAAGGSGADAGVSTADTELLAALEALSPDVRAAARSALPALTHIYFSALAAHSTILFPLPARSTFPTPSAQKSALEVLGLTKRRELAGRWVGGVLRSLRWDKLAAQDSTAAESQAQAAQALSAVLEEVERQDLYRQGQATEAWTGVFDVLVRGTVERVEAASSSDDLDAHVSVINLAARLAYVDVEPYLPRILAKLARTRANTLTPSLPTVSAFLDYCIDYHSRSLTLHALLLRISDALASTTSPHVPNSLLTTASFVRALGQAVAASPSSSSAVRSTWEALISPVRDALEGPQQVDTAAESQTDTPSKKRKRTAVCDVDQYSAASRLRVLTLYVRNLPDSAIPTLSSAIRDLVVGTIDEHLKPFAKEAQPAADESGTSAKKAKKAKAAKFSGSEVQPSAQSSSTVALGVEMLDFRYFAVERLRREDLLTQQEDGKLGDWWLLRGKRRESYVVRTGVGESAIVAARVLLQHAELLARDPAAAPDVQVSIGVILDRIGQLPSSGVTWDGRLRDLAQNAVGLALYESVTRRWLSIVNRLATDSQLAELSRLILGTISTSAPSTPAHTASSGTIGLLGRSDFWELTRLRAAFLATLRAAATVPALASANEVLHFLANGATATSQSSADASEPTLQLITAALTTLASIAAAIPREYLDSSSRTALADSALGIDLWISSERCPLDQSLLQSSQRSLRQLVTWLDVPSLVTAEVAALLVSTATLPARNATVTLCRSSLFEPALAASKNDSSAAGMVAIIRQFGKTGLSELSKRFATEAQHFSLRTEEQVVLSLLDLLAESGDLSSLTSSPAASLLDTLLQAATEHVDVLAKGIAKSVEEDPRRIFSLEDALSAVLTVQRAQSSIGSPISRSGFSAWVDTLVSKALFQLQSFRTERSAMRIAQLLLKMLVLRSQVGATDGARKAAALQAILPHYLAFQAAIPRQGWAQLEDVLLASVAAASAVEYDGALQILDTLLAELATSPLQVMDAAHLLDQFLSTTSILLLSGPEGSGRAATNALADVLRNLTAIVARYEHSRDAQLILTHVGAFLEGVCSERPLLLSRLNTSAVLSLVALCTRPAPSSVSSANEQPTQSSAGEIFCSLVAAVGHVVRHRKDHLVTLFPSLIAVVSSFLSILRRSGLGSLGNSTTLDDLEAATNVGQRAEREVKSSFPAWVWSGGLHSIGKPEAKALGRLLGSLGSKTTSTGGSRRKNVTAEDAASTTSLVAPLSKHAPFLLLNYLRACVHSTCPIPSALRSELQGGWFEVMDAMGKWEREALMKGLLGEEEEAERGILRAMWSAWEKERYRG
ncbi:hypothetical protein JCM10908_006542 [Rhodotorula pacifica]|uniref:Urb2 domain-containing protein n=1 Tax=Rhodotorula pacifica TaxID=1495444 RepID=UPI00317A4BC4